MRRTPMASAAGRRRTSRTGARCQARAASNRSRAATSNRPSSAARALLPTERSGRPTSSASSAAVAPPASIRISGLPGDAAHARVKVAGAGTLVDHRPAARCSRRVPRAPRRVPAPRDGAVPAAPRGARHPASRNGGHPAARRRAPPRTSASAPRVPAPEGNTRPVARAAHDAAWRNPRPGHPPAAAPRQRLQRQHAAFIAARLPRPPAAVHRRSGWRWRGAPRSPRRRHWGRPSSTLNRKRSSCASGSG